LAVAVNHDAFDFADVEVLVYNAFEAAFDVLFFIVSGNYHRDSGIQVSHFLVSQLLNRPYHGND
jgi:hypothetical protein